MATVRQIIKNLQERVKALEEENASLRTQQQIISQPNEDLEEQVRTLNQRCVELCASINHHRSQVKLLMEERDEIRIKCREEVKDLNAKYKAEIDELRGKLHRISCPKPKVIIVDLAKEKMEEYSEVLSMAQNLQKENEALYELVDNLEKRPSEIDSQKVDKLQKQVQELEELLSTSDEVYQKEHIEFQQRIDELEEENASLRADLQNLNGKIISKDIMINSYKDRYGKAVIKEGVEKDLYTGEQTDMIRELIEKQLPVLEKNSRRYCVFMSILEANPENGERKRKMKNVMQLFKGFSGFGKMNEGMKKEFANNGFDFVETSTHTKMYLRGEDRFFATLANTGSGIRSLNNGTAAIKSLL